MTPNQNTGSFPTWDGMRELEARVAALTEDRQILLRDIGKLRVRLAAVESLCDDYDSNGNAAALGDPCASVWHKVARQVRSAARGNVWVDTQLHHDFEPPPASTGPDGCRRCGQPEISSVHR